MSTAEQDRRLAEIIRRLDARGQYDPLVDYRAVMETAEKRIKDRAQRASGAWFLFGIAGSVLFCATVPMSAASMPAIALLFVFSWFLLFFPGFWWKYGFISPLAELLLKLLWFFVGLWSKYSFTIVFAERDLSPEIDKKKTIASHAMLREVKRVLEERGELPPPRAENRSGAETQQSPFRKSGLLSG